MPVFRYRALTDGGEVVEGEMEAVSGEAVATRLQTTRHFPIHVEPRAGAPREARLGALIGRMSGRDLATFTRELATLLGAGLPLDRALEVVASAGAAPRVTQRTERMLARVRGGQTFAAALEAEPGFPRLYPAMVRAGEASGSLDTVLTRLADYVDKARELRDTVITAMIYPAILVAVAVVSLVVLLTQVVPRFRELFADAGATLPLATRIVIAASDWLASFWWALLLGAAAGAVGLVLGLRVPALRLAWDRMLLAIPLIGGLMRKIEVARFARTLATLLANGVVMVTALAIVRETVGNSVIAVGVDRLIEGLKEGRGLAGPLAKAGLFPDMASHMIRVGEETGQLEAMLAKVAEAYDREVAVAIRRLLALLEPALILTLGLIIAGIIIAVLLAVLSVNELAF